MQVDPFRRLLDDLARRPDSPTLNALAERDETGAVIGTTAGPYADPLVDACVSGYLAGADLDTVDSFHQRPTVAHPDEALYERVRADLDRFPDLRTLNALALRDATGAVIGIGRTYTPLEMAYAAGADAALIDEAERLDAFVGSYGDRGYVHRATRLNRVLRCLNHRLARFSRIGHTLGTVTIRAARHGRGPRRLSLTIKRSNARGERLTRTVPMGALRAGAVPLDEPPPLDAAQTASLLSTGPPASPEVRPRPAALGTAASHPRKVRLALAA